MSLGNLAMTYLQQQGNHLFSFHSEFVPQTAPGQWLQAWLGAEAQQQLIHVLFIESAHWANSIIESRCPLYICMSVPLHVLDFEAYFAPTSRSRMSKILRDLESLGKSAGKKWSQN